VVSSERAAVFVPASIIVAVAMATNVVIFMQGVLEAHARTELERARLADGGDLVEGR
jgi:hypothetical protein